MANRTIKHLLKVYCEEHIDVWDEYLWCLTQAYNSTVQISSGCTPFILMNSWCDLPFDLLYSSHRPDLVACDLNKCASQYLVEQKERMPVIHELVRRNLDANAGMQQRGQIQGGLLMRELFVGQKVWWYYPPSANQKLKYPWTVPYEVIDVAGGRNVVLIKGQGRDSWVNSTSLKPVMAMPDGQML